MSRIARRLVPVAVLTLAAMTSPAAPSLQVETGSTTALGLAGRTINGRIQPHGQPTRWWVEYGPAAPDRSTAATPLPPQLAAYFHEDWESGRTSGWGAGMSQRELQAVHDPATGERFIRFAEPSSDDPNHVDGVGTLHLAKFLYSGALVPRRGGSAYLGGGNPDFRDAEISLRVRGRDFRPNGAELLWWTQRMVDISLQFTDRWACTNWAYTGFLLTDALASGRWETIRYRLENHSERWSYAGNNLTQERPERYVYESIDTALGGINADFFHLLCFVDPANRPTGAIDFDDLTLRYRNYSLLRAANGGSLVAAPAGSPDAAANLTDGWRHGPDRMWRSAPQPAAPLEFTYRLAPGATVDTVVLHQHTEWPAREVEVRLSADGQAWDTVLRGEIARLAELGANFTFQRESFPARAARFVQVRVLSGYRPEHWGLGEIEVFGGGVPYATDDDWYNVNVDLTGLQPGTTYRYRLVAESDAGRVTGAEGVFTTPVTRRPEARTGPATRVADRSACLTGRLTAFGLKTGYFFEYGRDENFGARTPSVYGGLLDSPRLVQTALTGLEPDTVYHYRLVGVNAEGTTAGPALTFRTAPAR